MSVRKEFREFVAEARDFRRKLKLAVKDGISPEEGAMLREELGEVITEGAEVLGATKEMVQLLTDALKNF